MAQLGFIVQKRLNGSTSCLGWTLLGPRRHCVRGESWEKFCPFHISRTAEAKDLKFCVLRAQPKIVQKSMWIYSRLVPKTNLTLDVTLILTRALTLNPNKLTFGRVDCHSLYEGWGWDRVTYFWILRPSVSQEWLYIETLVHVVCDANDATCQIVCSFPAELLQVAAFAIYTFTPGQLVFPVVSQMSYWGSVSDEKTVLVHLCWA